MINFLKNKIFLVFTLNILTFLLAKITYAQYGAVLPACTASGNCSLCDFLVTFSNIANYMLTALGSCALLLFVYGGITWLTASGSMERVKKGKDILVNTIIGLIIVLSSWQIINLVISSLTGTPSAVVIFSNGGNGQPWYNYCISTLDQMKGN